MSKRGHTRRKGAPGQPPEGKGALPPSAPAPAKAPGESSAQPEAAIPAGGPHVHGRETAADLLEEALEAVEAMAEHGSTSEAQLREANERLVLANVKAQAMAQAAEQAAAQLREANERLVVATVNSQTMADAAETSAAQMSYLAEHDFLTGLPNRSLLTDRMTQAIALAERHGKTVALMYMDLDHFKDINDSLGHAVGDQLLKSIAARLQACVRHSDTVSRQGGDEFAVLLPEVEAHNDAIIIAQKLIEAMAPPHLIGGHQLQVTLSIGISHFPDDGRDVDTVLKHADTAMYHAKQLGRNNFQVFTPGMNLPRVPRQTDEQGAEPAPEARPPETPTSATPLQGKRP